MGFGSYLVVGISLVYALFPPSIVLLAPFWSADRFVPRHLERYRSVRRESRTRKTYA